MEEETAWTMSAQGKSTYEDYLALFGQWGGTDEAYLADHYQRFVATLAEFRSGWTQSGARVLDVGAHWLHQAVMWRQAGFAVIAVDLPSTFSTESVRQLAQSMDIHLIPCADLEHARVLEVLPDDSVDVVLFTEIIEHITFNPLQFWRQVYRVLAPGGRILVTTPNYYSWKGRAWQFLRFARGMGGGLSVDRILGQHTYAHHWREFSRREMLRYFALLSPDFQPVKAKLMPAYAYSSVRWKSIVQRLLDCLPLLRPNLHLEIALPVKSRGITAKASW